MMYVRHRREARALGLTLLLSLAASAAPAQSPAYASPAPQDTAMDASLVRVIQAANTRGLPAEPLLAKVREGRLKRAATPRIRNALAALVTRLDSARAALGPSASADELVAAADALAAGADGSAVRAVRAASIGQPASAPLGALAQLVASGVSAPKAASMVVELLRRRASPAQVLAFGNLVELDVATGLPADESATLRLHSFDARSADAVTAPDSPPVQNGTTLQSFNGRPTGATAAPPPKTPKRRP
jgi:hypothetical protein